MQDQVITAIGKVAGNSKTKPYQNFIGDMFPGKSYDMILADFRFQKKEKDFNCLFEKIDIEKVSIKNYLKFAYRKGSARGGDITFTTKFGDINKKFRTFYPKQVNDVIAFAEQIEETQEVKIFKAFKECLEKSSEEVKAKLLELYESLSKKQQQSAGFSIRFRGLEGIEYLEDFKSIQKLLYQVGTSGKSEKYKVISEGYDEVCSICLDKKPLLHGFASPFKYATVDKTGLVSGFFNQKNNWKNYPICSECALDFELGNNYVTQKLSRYFYGKSYFIIPKVVVGNNPKLLKRALNTLEEIEYKMKEGEKLAGREDYLMKKIGNEEGDQNVYTLNLLFYEENQTTKAIKIKLFLEEILPSRFRKLFVDVPKVINSNSIFKDAITIKKEKRDIQFSFGILKTFFDNDFYEIIQTVFLERPISEELLFSKFMRLIRTNYNKSQTSDGFVEPIRWIVLKAIMALAYLKELNIISRIENAEIMEIQNQKNLLEKEQQKTFDEESFRSFLSDNVDFLNTPERVGIFSVGVYVRFLLDIQNVEFGSTPFEKKLRGYNLSPPILEHIYLEAYKKISQYKNFYTYSNLREIIKKYYILNKNNLGQISNNELSFYFVAGLEFGNQFKTKKSNKNG